MGTKEQIEDNPYLNAKREWLERYGDLIKGKRNWQIVAFICLIIALISVIYIGHIGSQNKLIPYVIEVDKLGNIQKVGTLKQGNLKVENVIKFSIQTFIYSWRTVWGDPETQKKFIFDAYKYLIPNNEAYNHINSYYRKNNPFEKAKENTVRVKITNLVPQSLDTWQVEWEEETLVNEVRISKEIYRGLFTVIQIEPTTEEAILNNPLGIFITALNYSEFIK
ncbi:VirB8/TrbF family protein [Arcobacter lacus]|uniref:VirB8/TrbF family protein n=1 Tax=Arcobacter lacus TaxID=1912876 RepID=UPI0021BB08F8|nr:VirB8/TrbF family protein [Arcobacter lacus]MCT7910711.1 VirB8/TrbF family protein [Arcobacter lacus]